MAGQNTQSSTPGQNVTHGQNTLTFTDDGFDRTYYGRKSRFWWIFGPSGAAPAG